MLLESNDVSVLPFPSFGGTPFNILLSSGHPRATKLSICRAAINHIKNRNQGFDHAMDYVYATLLVKDKQGDYITEDHCQILVDAGIDPAMALHKICAGGSDLNFTVENWTCDAQKVSVHVCTWLVQHHGANPFRKTKVIDSRMNEYSSPFHKAACLKSTAILDSLLPFWTDCFPNGVNSKGNNPIHGICCENKDVSLEAIQAVMASFKSSSSTDPRRDRGDSKQPLRLRWLSRQTEMVAPPLRLLLLRQVMVLVPY